MSSNVVRAITTHRATHQPSVVFQPTITCSLFGKSRTRPCSQWRSRFLAIVFASFYVFPTSHGVQARTLFSRKRTKLAEQLDFKPVTHGRIHDFSTNVRETDMDDDSSTFAETQTLVSKAHSCDSLTDENSAAPSCMILSSKQNFGITLKSTSWRNYPTGGCTSKLPKRLVWRTHKKSVENLSNVFPVSATPNTVDETPQTQSRMFERHPERSGIRLGHTMTTTRAALLNVLLSMLVCLGVGNWKLRFGIWLP